MQKLLNRILVGLNVAIVIGMMVTGYAYYLNPVEWGVLALAGYGFPVFLLANIAMIFVWAFVRYRYALIPTAGLLLCYMPVMKYTPLHLSSTPPDDCITFMTYNTWNFSAGSDSAKATSGEEVRRRMLRFMRDSKADIICLQESNLNEAERNDVKDILGECLPYVDTLFNPNSTHLVMLSRYPITNKQHIDFESKGNISGAFTLNVNGKTVIVVNNHLETNSFSTEEKDHFSDVMHGNQGKRAYVRESRYISDKLADAAKIRAPQADAVASYLRMHKGARILLCGDFNDIPLSYAHHTIAHELTDCYRATGFGPGFTYSKHAMRVRIDNIMCSDHFTPYDCYVDKSIGLSDHYPVICKLSMKY